jgi:hypothetical protein
VSRSSSGSREQIGGLLEAAAAEMSSSGGYGSQEAEHSLLMLAGQTHMQRMWSQGFQQLLYVARTSDMQRSYGMYCVAPH